MTNSNQPSTIETNTTESKSQETLNHILSAVQKLYDSVNALNVRVDMLSKNVPVNNGFNPFSSQPIGYGYPQQLQQPMYPEQGLYPQQQTRQGPPPSFFNQLRPNMSPGHYPMGNPFYQPNAYRSSIGQTTVNLGQESMMVTLEVVQDKDGYIAFPVIYGEVGVNPNVVTRFTLPKMIANKKDSLIILVVLFGEIAMVLDIVDTGKLDMSKYQRGAFACRVSM